MSKKDKCTIAIENFAALFQNEYGESSPERLYPSSFSKEELKKGKAFKIQKILHKRLTNPNALKIALEKIIGVHKSYSKRKFTSLKAIVNDLGFNIDENLELTAFNSKKFEYDVALSYATEDNEYAEMLAKSLKTQGIETFFFPFERGKTWGKDLYEYLAELYSEKARYCIMFLSENYARKLWTNHERQNAQARAFKEHQEYILPIRLDKTKIPGIRETICYVNWFEHTISEISEFVLDKLKKKSTDNICSSKGFQNISLQQAQEKVINFVKQENFFVKYVKIIRVKKIDSVWKMEGRYHVQTDYTSMVKNFEITINQKGNIDSFDFDRKYNMKL